MSDPQEFYETCWFEEHEALGIKDVLIEANIIFQIRSISHGETEYGSHIKYIFDITRDQFFEAIELIKEFFSLLEPQEYTGTCPACNSHVEQELICPTCDLNLSGNTLPAMYDHPFVLYLQDLGLLE